MAAEAKKRGWDWKDTYAVINTFNELDTGKKRTDGSIKSLEEAGIPKDHILTAALKTLDVPAAWTPPTRPWSSCPAARKT